jgi:SAM-dependent methyltransferase
VSTATAADRAGRVGTYENARPEVQALVPRDARRVLDLGCPSGALGAALKARQGCAVVGVEVDPLYAPRARERLDEVVEADLETFVPQTLDHPHRGQTPLRPQTLDHPQGGLTPLRPQTLDHPQRGQTPLRPQTLDHPQRGLTPLRPQTLNHPQRGLTPFDCIVAADVLEHLRDPLAVLRRAADALAPGGAAVVSLPNVRYWNTFCQLGVRGRWPQQPDGIFDRTHLRWFTGRDAVDLMAEAGLALEEVRRIHRLRPSRVSPWDERVGRIAERTPLRPLLTFQVVLRARKPRARA